MDPWNHQKPGFRQRKAELPAPAAKRVDAAEICLHTREAKIWLHSAEGDL
jgi:hypothetical protein